MARTRTFDPEEVLQQAMELFWEQGYEATSVQDLVDRTGLSRSSLYGTFGDKHALYLQALDRYRQAGMVRLRPLLEQGSSPKGSLRNAFEAVAQESAADRRGCFMANATVERAACDAETGRRAQESLRRMQEAFKETVERAQTQGEIGAGRDAQALGRFLANAYYGLRVMARAGATKEELRDVVETTLAALE